MAEEEDEHQLAEDTNNNVKDEDAMAEVEVETSVVVEESLIEQHFEPELKDPQSYVQEYGVEQIDFQQAIVQGLSNDHHVIESLSSSPATVNLQTQSRTPRKRKGKSSVNKTFSTRGKNFILEEDIALCKAYSAASQDGTIGKDQASSTMWERVLVIYKTLISDVNDRTRDSLSSRMTTLKQAISKYSAKLGSVYQQDRPGWSELDRINQARAEYQQETGKPWTHEECWAILKGTSKWSFDIAGHANNGSVNTPSLINNAFVAGGSNPGTPATSHSGDKRTPDDAGIDEETPRIEQPNGRTEQSNGRTEQPNVITEAKETTFNKKLKRSFVQQAEIKEAHKDLLIRYIERAEERDRKKEEERERRRMEMSNLIRLKEGEERDRQRLLDLEERKEEDRVMAINLNDFLDDESRTYWQWRKSQIMQKRMGCSEVEPAAEVHQQPTDRDEIKKQEILEKSITGCVMLILLAGGFVESI